MTGFFQRSRTSPTLWEVAWKARVVTLIGAGGKTTGLNRLVRELAALGKPVVATTTTKVYPQAFPALWHAEREAPPKDWRIPCFWYSAVSKDGSGKWIGIPVAHLDQALSDDGREDDQRVWVVEGDGARERQLKCWAEHEPQIPRYTETVILMIDGRLWGKPLSEEWIHRPERCPYLVAKRWTPELATRYILNSPVFGSSYQRHNWVVLFNEWDESREASEKQKRNDENKVQKVAEMLKGQTEQTKPEHVKPEPLEPKQIKPKHLRIAAGNLKEGRFQWYDLW